MADPLSIASGITALLGLCGKIIKLLSTAKGASKDLRIIDIEIKAFKTVLEELKGDALAEGQKPGANQSGVNTAVKGCQKTLEELTEGLEGLSISESCSAGPGKRRKLKDSLVWTWKKDDTDKLVSALQQHKTTLMMGLLGETSRDIKEIKSSVDAVRSILSDQERNKIISWIQQNVNPSIMHNTACAQRMDEESTARTGEWVLRTREWSTWIDAKDESLSRLLWINGIPGAGKTVLASFLIDQCMQRADSSPQKKAHCVYYYCSYRHNRDESESFMRWTVSQLCRSLGYIPPRILSSYRMDHHPHQAILMYALVELLWSTETVYVVVDGVDESKEPRDYFLDLLVRIATTPLYSKIRLLAISRRYASITSKFEAYSMSMAMSNEEVDKDIRKYVTREINKSWHEPWKRSLRDEVVESLVAGAQGMFQWASCQIRILNRKRNPSAIRKALKELPKDLDETYERILAEIPEDDRSLARNVFAWLHGHIENHPHTHEDCYQFLPADVLLHALNFQQSIEGSPSERYPPLNMGDVVDICGCLLTMVQYKNEFEPEILMDTVKFSHYTVLEFLISERTRESGGPTSYFLLSGEDSATYQLKQSLEMLARISFEPTHYGAPYQFKLTDNSTEKRIIGKYLVDNAMEVSWYGEGAALGSDDLWPNLLHTMGPKLLRSPLLTEYLGLISLAHWDGDERTEDAVQLCDLVMNGNTILAEKLLHERGGQNLFQTPIRSYGLEPVTAGSYEPTAPPSFCYEESPFAIVGICLLMACICRVEDDYVGVEDSFNRMAILGSRHVDTSTSLYSVIPLHFEGFTCCRSSSGPDDCAILEEVLRCTPGFDLNNKQYQITPLQLAVYCWNLRMARFLVKHGADVNGVGCRDGMPLPQTTIYHISDKWCSATPLNIVRNASYGLDEFRQRITESAERLRDPTDHCLPCPVKEGDREELEEFLLENGAVDDDGTGDAQETARRC